MWGEWERAFQPSGGRTTEWRFRVELPPLLRDLDKSSGLDHRELTARTLVAGSAARSHHVGDEVNRNPNMLGGLFVDITLIGT